MRKKDWYLYWKKSPYSSNKDNFYSPLGDRPYYVGGPTQVLPGSVAAYIRFIHDYL